MEECSFTTLENSTGRIWTVFNSQPLFVCLLFEEEFGPENGSRMEKLSQFLRLYLKFMVVNLYLYVEVETGSVKLCGLFGERR